MRLGAGLGGTLRRALRTDSRDIRDAWKREEERRTRSARLMWAPLASVTEGSYSSGPDVGGILGRNARRLNEEGRP